MEFLAGWFNTEGFMPHGMCILWTPELLWTMVGADLVIALSYYSIPAALLVALRRHKGHSLGPLLLMFSAFIFACGTTHVVHVITVWYPFYWLDAAAKAVTALISAATAIALWPIVAKANDYVSERMKVEKDLREKNEELAATLSELEVQRSDLQFLNHFGTLLDVANTEDEVAALVADAFESLWPENPGKLLFRDAEGGDFVLAMTWGEPSEGPRVVSHSACWSCRLSRPFPRAGNKELHCKQGACGADHICIPVIGGGDTHALLHLDDLTDDDPRLRTLGRVLTERLGLTLHNLRLKKSLEYESTRDPLTGLFNRRYMDEALALEARRAARDNGSCAVILCDLDRFKALNDTHGHDVGDAGIRLFASALKSTIRASDAACRYGGEEFLVLLPAADREAGRDLAERIRVEFEGASLAQADERLRGLTVSAGVAATSIETNSAEELLRAADSALYAAKAAGRNTVRVANQPAPATPTS